MSVLCWQRDTCVTWRHQFYSQRGRRRGMLPHRLQGASRRMERRPTSRPVRERSATRRHLDQRHSAGARRLSGGLPRRSTRHRVAVALRTDAESGHCREQRAAHDCPLPANTRHQSTLGRRYANLLNYRADNIKTIQKRCPQITSLSIRLSTP